MSETLEPSYPPTALSRVRRHPERGHYDEAAVNAVLDAALMAHVGYLIDGRPLVTPTLFWREGRRLFWHGAAASRMLKTVAGGAPVCVTVSLMDGLVLAPSHFVHSMNYRSVMAFGHARLIEDEAGKLAAADAFIERIYPGRAATLRRPSEMELRTTSFVTMEIEEASAKVREGGVANYELDAGWPAWSGVIPVETRLGAPIPDSAVGAHALGLPTPPPCPAGARLDALLTAAAQPGAVLTPA
jgi:nitroimidazol reductase NimA-like FMN-containing flavoprotein (pyridoxamine 5'-phosphate oxidase superfamily)